MVQYVLLLHSRRFSRQHPLSYPVTGSSQGIGRALLDAVLAAGERAVATLRRPEALASYTSKYPATQLLVLPLDVTSVEQIDAAFARVKEHFGRVDVVVNNAGYGLVAEIEGTPEAEARKCFETLFWGPFHIVQRVRPEVVTALARTDCPFVTGCPLHEGG